MNNKILIGFVVLVAVLLVAPPVVVQMQKNMAGGSAAKQGAPGSAPKAAPKPMHPAPQATQHQAPPPPPPPQNPMRLTAKDLEGTAWIVPTPQGDVTAHLNPRGNASLSHPMAGTFSGNWRVNGNKLTVNATVMGQKKTITATYRDGMFYAQGQMARRIR